MNLLERIESLHGLIAEAETLTEAPYWERGMGSKWGTRHGKPEGPEGAKKIWTKGGYQPVGDKEYGKGVQGYWKYLPGTGPIFIITKRAKLPKGATRSKKAKAMFKGRVGAGGRLKRSGKVAARAEKGWATRKANIKAGEERTARRKAGAAKGASTRKRRALARQLGAGAVEHVE